MEVAKVCGCLVLRSHHLAPAGVAAKQTRQDTQGPEKSPLIPALESLLPRGTMNTLRAAGRREDVYISKCLQLGLDMSHSGLENSVLQSSMLINRPLTTWPRPLFGLTPIVSSSSDTRQFGDLFVLLPNQAPGVPPSSQMVCQHCPGCPLRPSSCSSFRRDFQVSPQPAILAPSGPVSLNHRPPLPQCEGRCPGLLSSTHMPFLKPNTQVVSLSQAAISRLAACWSCPVSHSMTS